jgi:formimidoylglutamate deiminase
MDVLILEPEFMVDFNGSIQQGPIIIENGRIVKDHPKHNGTTIRLHNQVILPGFVNCHSHAFQRGLRGLVEQKTDRIDSFFTWRERMYQLIESMSITDFSLLARLVYLEMLEAGFTHVGEFHYVHHDLKGARFKDPLAMSRALCDAASEVGINLVLLECAYNRANFDEPLLARQQRFGHPHVDDFVSLVKQAHRELENDHVKVGAAIHSVRAVPEAWLSPINEFVTHNAMPLHIHASEQEQDVADCLRHTGLSPIGLIHRNHLLAPHTTLVHTTHLINDDLEAIKESSPSICICPSTEKNLGDGVVKLLDLYRLGINICLGTDQHVRLDPFCEARSLEEQERLRLKKRTILGKPDAFLHQTLLNCLNTSGMRSLYPTFVPSRINQPANLIAVTLPPEYQWHGPQVALDAMMLSHTPAQITHVITNGHIVVHDSESQLAEKQYLINQLKKFFKN